MGNNMMALSALSRYVCNFGNCPCRFLGCCINSDGLGQLNVCLFP